MLLSTLCMNQKHIQIIVNKSATYPPPRIKKAKGEEKG